MNIYLVTRSYRAPGPGELNSIVVVAGNEKDARTIASRWRGAEGPDFWNTSHARVELLGEAHDGTDRKVCREFRES